jgi:hypothetical protein
MLVAVEWANDRLAALGLEAVACVVYSFGAARLLSASGRGLMIVPIADGDDGTAEGAVVYLVAKLERGLELLLRRT